MMSRRPRLFALLLCAAALVGACSPPSAPPLATAEERAEAWADWKTAKDSLFRGPASPLLPPDRDDFDSLSYFAYDSTLTFSIALDPALQLDTLRLATSTGEPRDYVRFGILSFPLEGRRHRLTVFQPVDDDPTLFVPFTDATNGRDTYRAGRYLDFEPAAGGRYVLDFNYAYNPYCAYNPAYSCPLPPAENRLSIPVRAGERVPG